jgi:hypothetical protein
VRPSDWRSLRSERRRPMPRPSKAQKAQHANSALQKAREAAGIELGLPTTDWRVVRLATLTAAHEALQAALAAGARIDFKELLEVDRTLSDVRKEIGLNKPPLAVQVTYVHPTTKCPACQHEFSLDLPDKDDNGSPVQAANTKPLPGDPYAVPKPAPGTVDLVVGAGKMATGRVPEPTVIDLEQQRADRSAELRDEALKANHHALKRNQVPVPSSPSIGSPFSDNESPVALSRRIDAAYRWA